MFSRWIWIFALASVVLGIAASRVFENENVSAKNSYKWSIQDIAKDESIFPLRPEPENMINVFVRGESSNLSAHEAGMYLEEGIPGYPHATALFTTKPYQGTHFSVGDIKALYVEGPKKNQVEVLLTSRGLPNGGVLDLQGSPLFCIQGTEDHNVDPAAGIYKLNISAKKLENVVNSFHAHHLNSPNDVVVHKDGTIWFTDPIYGAKQNIRPSHSLGNWVWRYDPNTQQVRVVADGFQRPNGLAFSPDFSILYVSDTGWDTGDGLIQDDPRTIYAFDVCELQNAKGSEDADSLQQDCPSGGILTNRRLIYTTDSGIPDGIKIDRSGNIYSGNGDGVHVVDKLGNLKGKISCARDCPTDADCKSCEGVANLFFGKGNDRKKLFMLAEGEIVSVTLNAEGCSECGR